MHRYGLGLALLLALGAPGTALALDCANDADCPEFFGCGEDSRCVELDIECGDSCPAHLSCQPTTTVDTGAGEPAPAGFLCAWVDRQCEETACEHEGFECVECDSLGSQPCQHCVPTRISCETHSDCPEFFYCFEFTEAEVPEYWPPGAGRACKPLLGPFPYTPRELDVGELGAAGGADAGPTSTTTGNTTNATTGNSTTSSDPAATAGVTTTAGASGGVGGTATDNSSTSSTSGEADTDAAPGTRESEGCSCSMVGSARGAGFVLGWALLTGSIARRRRHD